MKKTLSLLISFLSLPLLGGGSISAQTVIQGNLPELNGMRILLRVHGTPVDSADVTDGHLRLTTNKIDEPTYIILESTDQRFGTQFWIGRDTVTLSIPADQSRVNVEGSQTEKEYEEFSALMQPVYDHKLNLRRRSSQSLKEGNPELERQLSDSTKWVNEHEYLPRLEQFVRTHPRSYVSLNFIYNMRCLEKYPLTVYKPLIDLLDQNAFHGYQWKTINEYIKADEGLEPGHVFPTISGVDYYGNSVSSDNYKGKTLFVTISAAGCSEYDNDITLRQELYAKYKDKGLEFIDYLSTGNKQNILKAVAQHKLKWKVFSDFMQWDSPWFKANKIDHISRTYLVSPDGTIIANQLFGSALREAVENAMK